MEHINTTYHKLYLIFNSKEYDKDFHHYSVNRVKKLTQVAILIGLAMFTVTATIELNNSDENNIFFSLIFVPISSLFFLGISFTKYYEKYYSALIVLVYLIGGASIVVDFISLQQLSIFIYLRLLFFSFIAFTTIRINIYTNILMFLFLLIIPYYLSDIDHETIKRQALSFIPFFLLTLLALYIKKRIELNNFIKTVELNQKNIIINNEKQKIEKQSKALHLAHSNIQASIEYAKRIQNSLLSSNDILSTHFKDVSVIYKPKEVVSGDFYTFHKEGNLIYIATADCTGHGVPGGLVATLGTQEISHIIKGSKLTVDEILNKLNQSISKLLNNDNEYGSDGMDLTLICIDTKTNLVTYSGAKGIFYAYTNNELKVLKTDRISIGQEIKNSDFKFTLNSIQLNANDTLFLLTDGIIDQLDFNTNKRIGSKNIKKILLDTINLTPKEKESTINSFLKPRIKKSQTDDITLITFKL